jgi:hypothetical protein
MLPAPSLPLCSNDFLLSCPLSVLLNQSLKKQQPDKSLPATLEMWVESQLDIAKESAKSSLKEPSSAPPSAKKVNRLLYFDFSKILSVTDGKLRKSSLCFDLAEGD